MNLSQPNAELFVPDGTPLGEALARTTHLGIGAHPDDLELMAVPAILECFQQSDRWFTGVVLTDGGGSVRQGQYASLDDAELERLRRQEQRKAAYVGEYSAQALLAHTSAVVKDSARNEVIADLAALLEATRPECVYTHNLADRHDTHVAAALRVVAACRSLEPGLRPRRLIGCEAWRDLDWLCDTDKLCLPLDQRPNLQAALMGVFDSQISGGKRYDRAIAGRRQAHATFLSSHAGDEHEALALAMDLTPLLTEAAPEQLVVRLIRDFEADVLDRLRRLGP